MFSTLRNRFGIPGVISVIALVFAMFGGAYAASNSSGGGKATASAKAKKGPRGPKGATGPAGPQGPAGPAGPAGAKGDAGAAGAPGASATAVSFSGPKGGCNEGGVEVKSAGAPTFVCNGEEGVQGANGEPWTAGGVLPPNATETGTYLIDSSAATATIFEGYVQTAISFPIPLAGLLDEGHALFVKPPNGPTPAACENPEHAGAASFTNPEASPGFLCVYGGDSDNVNASELFVYRMDSAPGASPSGALLIQEFQNQGSPAYSKGTWAVTGAS
jgi:hypothetical protein